LRIINYVILQKNPDLLAADLSILLLDTTIDSKKRMEFANKILKDGLEGGILNHYLSSLFLEIKIKTALLDTENNVLFIRIKSLIFKLFHLILINSLFL